MEDKHALPTDPESRPSPENIPEKLILTQREIEKAVRKNAFPTWKDLLAIIGIFLVSSLLIGMIVPLFTGGQMTGLATFLISILTYAITIAFAVTLTKQRTGTLSNVLRFSFRGFNPAMILWGLILMLAAAVVIEPLISLFPSEWYEWVGKQVTNGGWAMAAAVVLAPICEEILFRGVIQDSIVRKLGPVPGILLASALFGIVHGIPQQVVAAFFLGTIIGFVYYKTGSLLSAMILHAINNALAVFLTLFDGDESAQEQSLREMLGNDSAYWILYAVCALLLILSLVRVLTSIRKGKEREMLRAAEKNESII